jgi:hypothetical protein
MHVHGRKRRSSIKILRGTAGSNAQCPAANYPVQLSSSYCISVMVMFVFSSDLFYDECCFRYFA